MIKFTTRQVIEKLYKLEADLHNLLVELEHSHSEDLDRQARRITIQERYNATGGSFSPEDIAERLEEELDFVKEAIAEIEVSPMLEKERNQRLTEILVSGEDLLDNVYDVDCQDTVAQLTREYLARVSPASEPLHMLLGQVIHLASFMDLRHGTEWREAFQRNLRKIKDSINEEV